MYWLLCVNNLDCATPVVLEWKRKNFMSAEIFFRKNYRPQEIKKQDSNNLDRCNTDIVGSIQHTSRLTDTFKVWHPQRIRKPR